MSNDQILQNKTIIVTGASTGIGQAFSVACSSYGAKIIVADMNSGEETVEIIKSKGGEAKFVEVDVANEKSTDLMAKAAYDWTGRVDGLINNAAYFREVKLTPFEEIDVAVWDKIFDVNVKGIWQCSKAVIPYMRNNNGGSIINISSVVAVAGQPGYLHYVATKGAVLAMTKGLAKECGKDLVRVNTIAPGFVITDATKNRPIEYEPPSPR